jgi:hypothetical protein
MENNEIKCEGKSEEVVNKAKGRATKGGGGE